MKVSIIIPVMIRKFNHNTYIRDNGYVVESENTNTTIWVKFHNHFKWNPRERIY